MCLLSICQSPDLVADEEETVKLVSFVPEDREKHTNAWVREMVSHAPVLAQSC